MKATQRQRAVGYVRVSTEEQVDNYSLRAQEREIKRFCERKKFQLLTIYSTAGFSAHHEDIDR